MLQNGAVRIWKTRYTTSAVGCFTHLKAARSLLRNIFCHVFLCNKHPILQQQSYSAELVFYWDGDNRFKPRTTVTILVTRGAVL